ncbi:MAG: hypothetical protein FJW32_08100 [Acidobacteria bacterium]|nr:hypothetical protein [Acidobacteriota bacterium]
MSSVGILVAGGNHFIVRGPEPSHDEARALARFWSLIQIGRETPDALRAWRISTREYREELEWARIMAMDEAPSQAVAVLLEELAARGIAIETVTMK